MIKSNKKNNVKYDYNIDCQCHMSKSCLSIYHLIIKINHTYIHTHIHTYIYTYLHTYLQTYIPTDPHTYLHTTYMHTYIHTYIPTYLRHTAGTCRFHAVVIAPVPPQGMFAISSSSDSTQCGCQCCGYAAACRLGQVSGAGVVKAEVPLQNWWVPVWSLHQQTCTLVQLCENEWQCTALPARAHRWAKKALVLLRISKAVSCFHSFMQHGRAANIVSSIFAKLSLNLKTYVYSLFWETRYNFWSCFKSYIDW